MSPRHQPAPFCWSVEEGMPGCPARWPSSPAHWCPSCRLEHGYTGPEPEPSGFLPVPFAAEDELSPGWHLHHFEPAEN